MGDNKLLVPLAGVLTIVFLPAIIVIALILGSLAGLDDDTACPPNGSFPEGGQATFGYPVGPDDRDVKAEYEPGEEEDDDPKHPGIDYDVSAGTDVLAIGDGEVIAASDNEVKIQHANDFQSWYKFFDEVSVEDGDRVTRGQKIGKSGSGGEDDPGADDDHLHLEIHIDAPSLSSPGLAVDPKDMMQDQAPSSSPSGSQASSPGGSTNGPAPSISELRPYPITVTQQRKTLSAEAVRDVETMIGVAKGAGLPPRAWVMILATVGQESGYYNNPGGDRDSVGYFQQRDAWGPRDVRMDAAGATRLYINGGNAGQEGLKDVIAKPQWSNWRTVAMWNIIQDVQHSGHPQDSMPWEQFAIDLVLHHYGAAPLPGGEDGGCTGGNGGGPAVGDYAFVLEKDSIVTTEWLTKPHHDYPAADVPVPTGTKAYAITNGTVTYVGGSCGIGLVVRTSDNIEYVYCHGESRSVPDGATVNPGDQVMVTASTGNSTGPHLHFGVKTPDGVKRCPQGMLINLYNGEQPPDPHGLSSSGCSY